ncbi:hypothetical protein THAOC_12800 [Thalassiosira oceanica]|uniref:Retrovirus-related Pol polyprotein from transposon TNT 1-94-like beta-barrel domain-containing protein n=1 Tax=Thalassiosira oceanica TaxID=159749 RepID=K0SZ44_THAOC|nr:hypothetical protein THAOC_12800 [Thalassiosira oceanica]|eukprot:EJK66286.1 hypothetical protein THAOC_12800 [Thalassiosira oceanica]
MNLLVLFSPRVVFAELIVSRPVPVIGIAVLNPRDTSSLFQSRFAANFKKGSHIQSRIQSRISTHLWCRESLPRSGATASVEYHASGCERRGSALGCRGSALGCRGSALGSRLVSDSAVPSPSCQHTTTSMGGAGRKLPTILSRLLSDPAAHAVPARLEPNLSPPTGAVVADSGATDHMFPDRSAFISYQPESSLRVKMGNNTYIPVRGRGSAVIELNGRLILVRDALHVPDLRLPLYSLRAHLNQPGCCFLGLPATLKAASSMHVCFPSFGRVYGQPTLEIPSQVPEVA